MTKFVMAALAGLTLSAAVIAEMPEANASETTGSASVVSVAQPSREIARRHRRRHHRRHRRHRRHR